MLESMHAHKIDSRANDVRCCADTSNTHDLMKTLSAIVLTCLIAPARALQCVDALGKAVDWWIALKRPGLSIPDGGPCPGSTYMYMDDTRDSFARGECLENPVGNPLSASLDPIYSSPMTSYVIINDQPSSINETTRGMIDPELHAHAKGVLAYDREGGLWLTHSTPEFPNAPREPYTGIGACSASGECGPQHGQLRFGQSFMCVSLRPDVLDSLASGLAIAAPVVASWRMVPSEDMPGVRAIVDAWESRAVVAARIVDWRSFASVAGQAFLHTVKSPTPRGQATYLYEEIIEPVLGDSLLVQSWSNIASECSRSDTEATMTVAGLSFAEGTAWRAGFSDHSKWAVTVHDDIATVCVTDLNRDGLDPEWSEGPDRPQSLRGGGATCLRHPYLWSAITGAITSTQPCVYDDSQE